MPSLTRDDDTGVREWLAALEPAESKGDTFVSSGTSYGYGLADWLEAPTRNRSDLPLHLNSMVAASLGWMTRNLPDADLQVVRVVGGENGPAVKDHPFIRLMDRPNALSSFRNFFSAILMSDVCDGTTFIVKIRNRAKGIHSLWWVPPWDVKEEPNLDPETNADKPVLKYWVTLAKRVRPYPPEDVIVIKDGYDPATPYRGLAPLKAGIRATSTVDRAEEYTRTLMGNCGAVPCVISPNDKAETIPEEAIPALRADWKKNQLGENSGLPFFSTGSVKVDKVGLTPNEMSLGDMLRHPLASIGALTGIPGMVLGYPDPNKTFSNLREAIAFAWTDGLVPRQRRYSEALDVGCPELIHPTKERLVWDYSHVKALQEDWTAKLQALVLATGGKPILLRNEARGVIHFEAVDGWDEQDTAVEEEPEEEPYDEFEEPAPDDESYLEPEDGKSLGLKRSAAAQRNRRRRRAGKPDAPDGHPSGGPGYNPNRENNGRFAAGAHHDKPSSGRAHAGGAKPTTRAKSGKTEGKPTPAAARAKSVGKIVGKEEHVYAEHAEKHLASSLGGKHLPDNEAVDAEIARQGGGHHGVEAKTLVFGKKQAVTMHPDAVLRKVHYEQSHPNNVVHTVVMDHRDKYKGGESAQHYSGHELYYKRGAGRYSLSTMHKVADHAELRKLIDTPDHLLPAKARGSLPKGAALEKLKGDAEKAHTARLKKDTDRKRRLREEARASV